MDDLLKRLFDTRIPSLVEAVVYDQSQIRLVAPMTKVWQLVGHKPEVATLALDEDEARSIIAGLLGVDALPAGAVVKRIR